jgi:hypothetical protein
MEIDGSGSLTAITLLLHKYTRFPLTWRQLRSGRDPEPGIALPAMALSAIVLRW